MKSIFFLFLSLLFVTNLSFANPCLEFLEMPFDLDVFKKCKVFAHGGDPEGEFYFASILMDSGLDAYNPTEAIIWFKKAAFQKHAYAQLALAVFQSGDDFPVEIRDLVDAYAWFATINPYPQNEDLKYLEKSMTRDEIHKAKFLAHQYQQLYTSHHPIIRYRPFLTLR